MKSTALSWIIGLYLFLTFLSIFIGLFSYKINLFIQENKPKKVETIKPKYIFKLSLSFDPNYVFFCKNSKLKDFCENFPIYIPFKFPDIYPQYGTFNNTIGEYFNKGNFSGIFLIVNVSKGIPNSNYMLVKVCNNENRDLKDVQIRIPIYYLTKYKGITNIKVTDGNKPLPFCFEHQNLECNITPSDIIWVKLDLSKKECKVLNISGSNITFAKDGSKIFDYYFTKFNVICKLQWGLWCYYACNLSSKNKIIATYNYTDYIDGRKCKRMLKLKNKDKVEINPEYNVIFNLSLFSNKITDFYMNVDDTFYVNDSYEYPSSSNYSWYEFYDLNNWISASATFEIDTIRVRKKANVSVEIIYPRINLTYYLILGEKPEKIKFDITNNYIKNNKNVKINKTGIWYGSNRIICFNIWYQKVGISFNETYTFAYANYSDIYIILPPNTSILITYNETKPFKLSSAKEKYDFSIIRRDSEIYLYKYLWQKNKYYYSWRYPIEQLYNGIAYKIYSDSDILLYLYLDFPVTKKYLYIFYSNSSFSRKEIEKIIEYFKYPKISLKYVAGP